LPARSGLIEKPFCDFCAFSWPPIFGVCFPSGISRICP
jgi:hypothetical protein